MNTTSPPTLHYEIGGNGPPLVLAHSLSSNLTMWEAQSAFLERHFTVVRFDIRGHGRSSVPPGPYTMRELAEDAAALLDRLDLKDVAWVGISLGGMIGQVLALARPDLIGRLVLADTTSGYPPAGQAAWNDRIAHVESGGMNAVVNGTLERWFTQSFRDGNPELVARIRAMILATDPAGFIACGRAIRDLDIAADIHAIACPTLVMVGEADHATPPDMARAIAAAIPGALFKLIPDAAHLSVLEQPEHLQQPSADVSSASANGAHHERALRRNSASYLDHRHDAARRSAPRPRARVAAMPSNCAASISSAVSMPECPTRMSSTSFAPAGCPSVRSASNTAGSSRPATKAGGCSTCSARPAPMRSRSGAGLS